MALILRETKGSPLTFEEMDGNLTYLESISGGGGSYYDNGNSSVNTSIDWSRGSLQELGIDNDPSLSFTGATAGQKLTLLLKRLVGESKKTITWADGVFWQDGVEFDLAAFGNVSLDSGFNTGFGFDSNVYSIALQPDGKILAGGAFFGFNSELTVGLARLNADGSLDSGFNIGFGFNNDVYSIALQPDGKILVGGGFTSFNGNTANGLVRLNADGSLDSGFNIGTGFSGEVYSIALQPDGKILAGGFFTSFDGNYSNNCLVRLNADGSSDTGFDIGTGFNSDVISIALQPDGKILVGGRYTSLDGNTANGLVRLNTDGTLDSGFDIGTGFDNNGEVYSIALQPDGKILVGGGFTSFDGNYLNTRLVRLNTDGSLDSGFDIGTGFDNKGEVFSITLQPDGKILVGGRFTSFDDNYSNRCLVRLNTDGSLDSGFDIGGGFDNSVRKIILQSDGKILTGGEFTSFDVDPANFLARLVELTGDVYSPVDLYYTGTRYIGTYVVTQAIK
jgi:uncharacterized delta-60 repeat protein